MNTWQTSRSSQAGEVAEQSKACSREERAACKALLVLFNSQAAAEAPTDATTYIRKSLAWLVVDGLRGLHLAARRGSSGLRTMDGKKAGGGGGASLFLIARTAFPGR